MTKPTVWRFSRKRDGQPLEKFEVIFPEKWDEPTPSQALRYIKREVERLGLK